MKKISALAIAGVFTASLAATAFAEMAEVKIGGEMRVRDVITNNYDFNDDSTSPNGDRENTVTSRTRINVDAKVNETTKAYISLQDTRVWGSESSTTTTGNNDTVTNEAESVDVSQAYMQFDKLFGQPLSIKLGRQTLEYGDQRLVGSFEWSNYARRFDGLKLMYNTDAFSVDLFSMKVFENATLSATGNEVGAVSNDSTAKDGYFNGIYATVKSIPLNTLDLYLLQKQEIAFAGEDFFTYGARINGGVIGIDWTAELAIQDGDAAEVAGTTIDKEAMFYDIKAGYTLPVASLRIGAEYVSASGDDEADDKSETFDNLFPTNHPLYGVSDVPGTNDLSGVSGSGLTAWSVNVSAKPVEGLKLLAEYWNYTATEDGALVDDKIGTEMNIQAWYALNENVNLHAFYARFSPDDALTLGGPDDTADNITLQVAVKF